MHPITLTTARLTLRQWQLSDHKPFAKMNACHDVMRYFPNILSEDDSNKLALKITDLIAQRGWGLWAVEEKQSAKFIGFVGLHQSPAELAFSPAIEIGWRLSKEFWGKGYATEAANKVLDFAFNDLEITQVVSFTAVTNKASQKVMQRINMTNTKQNFIHPLVTVPHLKEHVLYKITNKTWFSQPINN